MGILRTDVVSHSQLPSANGSIELDGTTDFIQIGASSVFRFADANGLRRSFTIEWFIYLNTTSGYHNAFDINYTGGLVIEGTGGVYSVYGGGQTLINEGQLEAATANRWYHYALVMEGGPAGSTYDIILYRDGKVSGQGTLASNVALGSNSNNLAIGARQSNGANSLNGFISNFRISEEAVYKGEFTPPKFKLKALPSTLVLCCQSSTSATEAAVSPTSVSANGNATASAFGPGLKDDITDVGSVFDGVTNFDSQAFMVPPSGKITQRNRGRGIIPGGRVSGSSNGINNISFIEIQSGGIGEDFGDLTENVVIGSSFASSTRAVRGGGYVAPSDSGVYDFVTIASTGNAQDFGDLLDNRHWAQGGGNQTRGILAGGNGGGNSIEFVTIASTGNGSDFGDLINSYTTTVGSGNGAASPTRLLFAGGTLHPSNTVSNIIQFVTIASTGNATDFGDLTDNKTRFGVCSSGTRGLYGGGGPAETDKTNTIVFVTLASTGNTTDFGDRTAVSNNVAATSNASRGVFIGGQGPSGPTAAGNFIDFVTITSTGNATDFGDNVTTIEHSSACSDSHGGLE